MVLAGVRPSFILIPIYSDCGLTSNNLRLSLSVLFPCCYNNSPRVAVRVVPLYEADIVAEVVMRTIEVLTLKVALVAPAGTVTLAGTRAAPLLLESVTSAPPAGAGPLSVTVPVEDPRPPTTLVGFSVKEETVGSGGAVTVNVIEVVCVNAPEVPVMVTGNVPVEAALPTASVNVLVAVAGLRLNDAVTPLGSPDADKETPLLKPFWGVTVIVLVPLCPWTTLTLLGDAESV